jgi:hypothetical protein
MHFTPFYCHSREVRILVVEPPPTKESKTKVETRTRFVSIRRRKKNNQSIIAQSQKELGLRVSSEKKTEKKQK